METRRLAIRPGAAGYKFLIHLRPSSSLAMSLAYRPSRTGAQDFRLPLTLHSSLSASALTSSAGAAAGAGASLDGTDAGEQASCGASGEGDGASGGAGALAVAVAASGVQPQLVLSKGVVEFGACVIGRGGSQRPSPYVYELNVRNNTDTDIQVRGANGNDVNHAQHLAFSGGRALAGDLSLVLAKVVRFSSHIWTANPCKFAGAAGVPKH